MLAGICKRLIFLLFIFLQLSCAKHISDNEFVHFRYDKNCKGETPCTISFTNESTGDAVFTWDFGDTSSSVIGRNTTHTYEHGDQFEVSLTAQYKHEEKKFKDTIYIAETPECDTKGSFLCAKKLTSDVIVRDTITGNKVNYYYFAVDTAGVIHFTLNPVPQNCTFKIELLSDPISNSPILGTAYGNGGDIIDFFAGPFYQKEYYVRLRETSSTSTHPYFNMKYNYINTDLNEMNGTFLEATDIGLAETKMGTIFTAGDDDYFRYYLNKPGVVDISVLPVPRFSIGPLVATVFGSASTATQIKQIYGTPGAAMKFSVGPVEPGYYYILLNCYNSSDASTDIYGITIDYDTSDMNEYNNLFSVATPLSLNQPSRNTIKSRGDVDYFKFTALSNNIATIVINHVPSDMTLILKLYSEAATSAELGGKILGGGQKLVYISDSLQAGKEYYISVSEYNNNESNEQYVLTVQQ